MHEKVQEERSHCKSYKPSAFEAKSVVHVNEYFHALSLHRHRQSCLGLTERKFSCNLCNKRFKRADHMKKHQEIHYEEKVPCSLCKKSMKESYVKRHQAKFCRGMKKELFILEATAAHQLSDESKWTDNIIIEDEKTEY